MDDINILLTWFPLKQPVETKGHEMPNGLWYVYLPFDGEYHYVTASDVEVL